MKHLIWFPLGILLLVGGYMVFKKRHNRETDVEDLKELHAVYAKTIALPVPADSLEALIYQYGGPDCGNTTDEEYQSVFIPDLKEEPYSSALSSRYKNLPVLFEYDSLVDAIPKEKKLYLRSYGFAESKTMVRIEEHYRYMGKDTTLYKVATYPKGEWEVEKEYHVVQ